MAGSSRRSRRPSSRTLGTLGILGILGSLTCSAAMTAAAFGIGGAAIAAGAIGGMVGMADGASSAAGSGPIDAIIGFLVWSGPAILLLSLMAMGAATVMRRRAATGLVLVVGVVLFWGMYLQPGRLVMLVVIAVGMGALVITYIWTQRGLRLAPRRQARQTGARGRGTSKSRSDRRPSSTPIRPIG